MAKKTSLKNQSLKTPESCNESLLKTEKRDLKHEKETWFLQAKI